MKFSFYLAALLAALAGSGCWAQEAVLDGPELPAPDLHIAAPALNEPGGGFAATAPMAVASLLSVRPKVGLSWTDWGLIGTAATLRVLDYKTTETCLRHPQIFQEEILPNALVHNKPGFAAFEGSAVAANYFAYRSMARHHRSAVRVGQAIYDGLMGTAVSINYYGIEKYLH